MVSLTLNVLEYISQVDRGGSCATHTIERPRCIAVRILGRMPDELLKPLRRIIPTLIYRIERESA